MASHTILLAALLAAPASPPPAKAEAAAFFEKHIRPLLANRCVSCHGAEGKPRGGLRLDTAAGIRKGGDSGPLLVPGKPEQSLLIQAVRYSADVKMPPKSKLPRPEVALLEAWVKQGAALPDEKAEAAVVTLPATGTITSTHWAFQPVRDPAVPVTRDIRSRNPVDRFIRARLEAKGLSQAPAADRRTLIRRATFDLIGLPPTPDEINAFLDDRSPGAFAKVVDRLLASPHYGERWGRHWLDVARYADSNGMDENLVQGNAWRYRDYVIKAFNSDKRYDQFVAEQIAGDLLPDPSPDQLVATGFLALGPKMLAEDDPVKMQMDIVDEQIDTLGKTFVGLTLGCARCHDHKYDPIPTADYYSLAGIFKSTRVMDNYRVVARWFERPVGTKAEVERLLAHRRNLDTAKQKVAEKTRAANEQLLAAVRPLAQQYAEAARELNRQGPAPLTAEQLARNRKLEVLFLRQWAAYLKKTPRPTPREISEAASSPTGPFALPKQPDRLYPAATQAELKQLREAVAGVEKAAPLSAEAMGATEGTVQNVRIHLRGNHLTLGAEVPRRFPRVLAGDRQRPVDAKQSGRLELARWMTQPSHPLTARVLVNRVWHWHFGAGLVRSTDNFGLLGDRPSHPELLDWLASRFVEDGWSVKALHRRIMLSDTYQMSAAWDETAARIDPDNRLLWRWNRQRLTAEALRDALLAVSGSLDTAMGGSLMQGNNRGYVPGYPNGTYDRYDFPRKSVYLPVVRSLLYDVFQSFDFADPSTPAGERAATTIAPQALFALNGKLMAEQSRLFAQTLLAESGPDRNRIARAYERAFGRPATQAETARSVDFLDRLEAEWARLGAAPSERRERAWQGMCRVLLSANEFVYVE